jgi:hypothetical protein
MSLAESEILYYTKSVSVVLTRDQVSREIKTHVFFQFPAQNSIPNCPLPTKRRRYWGDPTTLARDRNSHCGQDVKSSC